jgi:hypothetical protein
LFDSEDQAVKAVYERAEPIAEAVKIGLAGTPDRG